MTSILFLINAIVAVGLIILILLQRSEGGAGGAFGGGSGGMQPIVRNPLARPTAVLAAIFLINSLLIAYTQHGAGHAESVMAAHEAQAEAPASADGLPAPTLDTPNPLMPATPTESSPTVPAR
ncbi:MAG: preprotein translocase subunit SecG [Pseudomonadaceae bacterium]|nr:preprotein translocase subunit SecG [Pseudomonadaceae bacterium]